MKVFDKIIAWITYGSDVLKTISKAMAAVRDNWPTMPNSDSVDNVPEKVATAGNSEPVKETIGV